MSELCIFVSSDDSSRSSFNARLCLIVFRSPVTSEEFNMPEDKDDWSDRSSFAACLCLFSTSKKTPNCHISVGDLLPFPEDSIR